MANSAHVYSDMAKSRHCWPRLTIVGTSMIRGDEGDTLIDFGRISLVTFCWWGWKRSRSWQRFMFFSGLEVLPQPASRLLELLPVRSDFLLLLRLSLGVSVPELPVLCVREEGDTGSSFGCVDADDEALGCCGASTPG